MMDMQQDCTLDYQPWQMSETELLARRYKTVRELTPSEFKAIWLQCVSSTDFDNRIDAEWARMQRVAI